jgi:glycosyltransferase involved in cell wall biosynthesis
MNNKKKLAYLGPEIPALSATFIYNEIFQLESLGYQVAVFSVNKTVNNTEDEAINQLKQRIVTLYEVSKIVVIKSNFVYFFAKPPRYLKSVALLFSDMFRAGLFTRLTLGLVYRFAYAVVLAEKLLAEDCQHLHVHFAHVPTDIAMYASALSGVPFSVTAHANDIFQRGWLLPEKVDRASFFATISNYNKTYLEQLGINKDKVSIIRCGVDSRAFKRKSAKPMNDKAKLGVVGRLVEKKGFDDLICAAGLLKEQGVEFELHIVGDGPLEQPLLELMHEQGLTENEVKFIGALPHSEISSFVKSLDVFVLPCKKDSAGDMDGIPVVLMEAMLTGIPVITTKLTGIPELVIDQKTGLLVEPGNHAELSQAIKKLLDDNALRSELIENAIAMVNKEFDLSVNSKRLAQLFDNVDAQ